MQYEHNKNKFILFIYAYNIPFRKINYKTFIYLLREESGRGASMPKKKNYSLTIHNLASCYSP